MKYLKAFSPLFLISALTFTSCSKCYNCTHKVDILDANGNVIAQEDAAEDFCTSSSSELQAKEDEGFTCVAN